MATFTIESTDWALRVAQEAADVTTFGPEPVQTWRYIDAAGHGHYYAPGYPTLTQVVDEWGEDEAGERYPVRTHMECPHCGEHVVPDQQYTKTRSTLPAMRRAWLERPGERIDLSPDEADDLLSQLAPPDAGDVIARWVASRSGE